MTLPSPTARVATTEELVHEVVRRLFAQWPQIATPSPPAATLSPDAVPLAEPLPPQPCLTVPASILAELLPVPVGRLPTTPPAPLLPPDGILREPSLPHLPSVLVVGALTKQANIAAAKLRAVANVYHLEIDAVSGMRAFPAVERVFVLSKFVSHKGCQKLRTHYGGDRLQYCHGGISSLLDAIRVWLRGIGQLGNYEPREG